VVVQVDVVSFSEEALYVDEANDLFGIGGKGVLCANDDDVGEQS